MNDRAAFARLVETLSPWAPQLVFVGGWAHRLYRLHPKADVPVYQPLTTLDADVAFGARDILEGSIKTRLQEAGFEEQLTGNHQPPVSQYTLGEDEAGGFYAEFLTPLIGRDVTKDGKRIATLEKAGITAQRLRYLELLLQTPWSVTLPSDWSATSPSNLRIPNPVSFIVQKLLIHDDRPGNKKAQDLLYIHDTLELFAPELEHLTVLWHDEVRPSMHEKWVQRALQAKDALFGALNDRIRDAAAIPLDRDLDPERMRAMCDAALDEVLK
ncbi:MAG TPA: GSU2403 family nucleotidyltransferase fold protein [Dyella sp.]|uniref:GSU2403 family nucleotidyltransferase fold protein n=1 Tax=Dyella sp. TaxID=1869338 RepID=UPI002F921F46